MKKLVRNAIRCKHCGDIIESKSVHDFEECSCGACFTDGGLEYLRRGFKTSPDDDYEELAEYEDVWGYHVEYQRKPLLNIWRDSGYETIDIPGPLSEVFHRFPQSEYYLRIKDEDGNLIFLNTINNHKEEN